MEGNNPKGGHRRVCEEDRGCVGVSHGMVEVKLLPRRKHTSFTTRRKFEIKRTMLLIFFDNPVLAARDHMLYQVKVEYERECVARILKDVFKAYCKMQYQHPLENLKKMIL